jgi:hypothetical protein
MQVRMKKIAWSYSQKGASLVFPPLADTVCPDE